MTQIWVLTFVILSILFGLTMAGCLISTLVHSVNDAEYPRKPKTAVLSFVCAVLSFIALLWCAAAVAHFSAIIAETKCNFAREGMVSTTEFVRIDHWNWDCRPRR